MKRAGRILDLESAVYFLQTEKSLFVGKLCLPIQQIRGWSFSRICETVGKGKLYLAGVKQCK